METENISIQEKINVEDSTQEQKVVENTNMLVEFLFWFENEFWKYYNQSICTYLKIHYILYMS